MLELYSTLQFVSSNGSEESIATFSVAMVKPVKRRQADPQVVINLWTAVSYIKQQKQIPNIERVVRYMEREHGLKKTECDRQLR